MNNLNIIIVSWNCKEYLLKCLCSICQYPPECDYKITVVDNASSDGTVEMLRSDFPNVNIITNESNRGFASANNLVLRQRGFRYYLLLNPDTEVYPDAIKELIEFAEKDSSVYCVGPKVVNADETHQVTGVSFPDNWNIFVETFFLDCVFPKNRIFGSHKKLYLDWSAPQILDYVQGSALLIKDEAIENIGLLDENFFLFFEETDWCYRVKKAGKRILYCPESVIKHYGGGEKAHYDRKKVIYYHESLFYFFRKHYKFHQRIILRFIILLRCIIRINIWLCVAIYNKSIRKKALSTFLGYLEVLTLIFRKSL